MKKTKACILGFVTNLTLLSSASTNDKLTEEKEPSVNGIHIIEIS